MKWFIAGWLARSAVSLLSKLTYRWRSERAWRKWAKRTGNEVDDK